MRWTLDAAMHGDKNHNPVLVAAGTPGIGANASALFRTFTLALAGKSSFGDAIDSILGSCALPFDGPVAKLTLVTSLSNGTSLSDVKVTADMVSQFLAARILRTALLPATGDMAILNTLDAIGITGPVGAIKVVREAVIQANRVGINAALAVVLVVDEVQRLREQLTVEHLRAFISRVGELQTAFPRPTKEAGGVFFSAVLLGTAYGAIRDIVRGSAFPLIRLPLPLLEPQHCQMLVQRAFGDHPLDWARLPVFEHALLLCGGWPRVLEFFVKEAQTWQGVRIPTVDITADDLPALLMRFVERLRQLYPAWESLPPRASFLLAASFLRYPLIADETVIRDEPKETLRAASEAGLCVIVPAKDDARVTLKLPPVMTGNWAQSLMQMTDEHDPLRHLASIRTVRYWAEFEEFVARHLAARIAFYGPRGVNAGGFSLQDLLWSAAAPAVRFRAPQAHCRVHRASHRWLAGDDNLPNDEDCAVVLCAAGTPAVDIVVLLRREDGSRFYVSVQVKHTRFGGTALDLQTVRDTEELLRRKLGDMRRHKFAKLSEDVYLVFITNRDAPDVAADALPARTAVLNTQTFMGATFARMADVHNSGLE